MQLEYEISAADHLESIKVRYRNSVRRLLMIFLGSVLLLLGLVAYPYFDRSWSIFEIGLSILILAVQLFLPRIVHRRIYYRNQNIFGLRKVSFDEHGLVDDGPQGHVKIPWNRYVRFRESKRLFLLYLSEDVRSIVPKHAFKNSSDMDAFRTLLCTRVPQA
jgi:hypothetical protein